MKRLIIAIDGPAGSGKSSTAKLLAKKLGYNYIDTGAMYRCVTLHVLNNNIDVNNEEGIAKLLDTCNIEVSGDYFFLNDEDVTEKIRSKDVTYNVSKVCSYQVVRNKMVTMQRHLARNGGVILDGRDIGTVVFPNADVKFYLTANLEVRALRRYQENRIRGIDMSLEEVMQDIKRRDEKDSTRQISPLKKAEDAIELDTSRFSGVEKNVEAIIQILRNKQFEEKEIE